MRKDIIQWTGERYLPSVGANLPEGSVEHYSRYYMAREFCRDKYVLDIASGEGYGSSLLADSAKSVVGIDIDDLAVRHASNKYVKANLKFFVRSATDLKLPERSFDVVVCFEMLEHIYEQEQLLEQVRKVLKPDGILIISTPNKYLSEDNAENDILHSEENPFHVKELYFDEFKLLLNSSFKFTKFYFQKVYPTSQICVHEQRPIRISEVFTRWADDSMVEDKEPFDQKSLYFIAICSDSSIEEANDRYYLTDTSNLTKNYYENQIRTIEHRNSHNITKIYFDVGTGYSEDYAKIFEYDCREGFADIDIRLIVPENAISVRIDPADESYCITSDIEVRLDDGAELNVHISNYEDWSKEGLHFFDNTNPQYVYLLNGATGQELYVRFSVAVHKGKVLNDVIRNVIQENDSYIHEVAIRIRNMINEFNAYKHSCIEINPSLSSISNDKDNVPELSQVSDLADSLSNDLDNIQSEIDSFKQHITLLELSLQAKSSELFKFQNSMSWRVTKPLRLVLDTVKKIMHSTKPTHLLLRGISSLRHNGITNTLQRINIYLKREGETKKFRIRKKNSIGAANSEYLVYDSEYQGDQDFSIYETDVKALAFFLPQFHTIPENDAWWGKGFTEWSNTQKAVPRFAGHYQPREPHNDIGYYDLSSADTLASQAALAKKHGVHGFCFYYYWFSGKKLLEGPIDLLLQHPEIDIKFCLCWANENWTRAWDGQNKEVLMHQEYSEKDSHQFIDDLSKYLDDPRYIRIDNRPVIIVYNPGQIPQPKKLFTCWRERAREIGIGEILIWTCQTANNTAKMLKIANVVDAEVEFPPHNMWYETIGITDLDLGGKEAFIYNYQLLVQIIKNKANYGTKSTPLYRCAMMGWDNAARRKNAWTTFYAFSLKSYYEWLTIIVEDTRRKFNPNERYVFINAWNEWAEGTCLEPDKKYGYANINTLSKALFSLPFDNPLRVINKDSTPLSKTGNTISRIAIQVHLFYTDVVSELVENLSKIPYSFDCLITTDKTSKLRIIEQYFAENRPQHLNQLIIDMFPNRGRDVGPFLMQTRNHLTNYDYICHLHTKKTGSSEYGDSWRKYLFRHLLGSEENVRNIIHSFESNSRLGLVFPETYPVLNKQAEWGGNKDGCYEVLRRLGLTYTLPEDAVFPVGNMFWVRTSAVRNLIEAKFTVDDFPIESGQTNATLAHFIERLWVYIVKVNGYSYLKTFNNSMPILIPKNRKRIIFYVHYDTQNIISKQDLRAIDSFFHFSSEFVFITNSDLSEEEINKIHPYSSKIIKRENSGYDFGAWKDALELYGFDNLDKFDQLILINNSFYGPIFDMGQVFSDMDRKGLDFWGITLFPHSVDGSYINKQSIPEHIQSYFQVFEKQVFTCKIFHKFWMDVINDSTFVEVISKYESELTKLLFQNGYKYSVLIPETRYISKYLMDYSIPYSSPYSLAVLGSPFVKKKIKDHMSFSEESNLRQFLLQIDPANSFVQNEFSEQ